MENIGKGFFFLIHSSAIKHLTYRMYKIGCNCQVTFKQDIKNEHVEGPLTQIWAKSEYDSSKSCGAP